MTDIRATQRLQFHREFTFDHATALVPYFARLGISHIYASPILKARPGSTHGYDVIDPTCINPELGGEPALSRLVSTLRQHHMGLIVDFVPNHMAVGGDGNPWWLDVLEWGLMSPYAEFFDIQWNSPDAFLKGRCLIPFLSSDYGVTLIGGDIVLEFQADKGIFYARHHQHIFPLYPPTYAEILALSQNDILKRFAQRFADLEQDGDAWNQARLEQKALADIADEEAIAVSIENALAFFRVEKSENVDLTADLNENAQRLHRLLERQNYRLASWHTAADDINWRRFFDINELAGLRMEQHSVFKAAHAKMFQLIARGWIDGLRIDHVDGLANPRVYCRKLRRCIERLLPQRPINAALSHFPIYVEKILAADEQLNRDWKVDGTTGYEFMNQVNLLLTDHEGGVKLSQYWQAVSGRSAVFSEEVEEARRQILTTALAGDFESVAQLLVQVAQADIHTRDFTRASIRRVLTELIVYFPVYRTYTGACQRNTQDHIYFQHAFESAQSVLSETDLPVLNALNQWLGDQALHELPPSPVRTLRAKALARFQQLTSPTAAKAVEDTAFYRSGALLSRNDVGFNPERTGAHIREFHNACLERLQYFPNSLLTTATHDHKRGEDTRARLAVLSERPDWFMEKFRQWRMQTHSLITQLPTGPAPSAGDEWILIQTLLGSWPLDYHPEESLPKPRADYLYRLRRWWEKALREAKLNSSWNTPNAAYEEACRRYLTILFCSDELQELRCDLAQAAMQLAPIGAIHSLAQTLLRLSTPGIPDLFQGGEYWDFSLVDPDNRRPVNFATRSKSIEQYDTARGLLSHWRDGRVKQHLIANVLCLRKKYPDLFARGNYVPLASLGENHRHCLAFLREWNGIICCVVIPRLIVSLLTNEKIPLISSDQWHDTAIELPKHLHGKEWVSILTGEHYFSPNGHLLLSAIFSDFPVQILVHPKNMSDTSSNNASYPLLAKDCP